MKRSTLELLCCPNCQAALSLRDERGDWTVDEGNLFCSQCEQSFLIKNGVAHFIDPQELEGINHRFAPMTGFRTSIPSSQKWRFYLLAESARRARRFWIGWN